MAIWKIFPCIMYRLRCIIRTLVVLNVFIDVCLSQIYVNRTTPLGDLEGIITTPFLNNSVECYLGVPYALPPIGPLRFEAPEPYPPWSGTRRAVEFSASCLQYGNDLAYLLEHRRGFKKTAEDCLYLNIYIPQSALSRRVPVLLFVHGGSNIAGAGPMVDGEFLASHGNIVVVTFNYRLGIFGFLGAGKPGFRGNYALLDQTMAMRWVKDNIASFNGDPDSVTIMGHSAGAVDVGLHMVSPLSRGLFRYVILQSGSPFSSMAIKDLAIAEHEIWNISKLLPCNDTDMLATVKESLKTLPAIYLNTAFPVYKSYQFPAIIDGIFLPDSPENLFASGPLNGERVLLGITKDEAGRFAVQSILDYANLITIMKGYTMVPEDMDLSEELLFEYGAWRTGDQSDVIKDVKNQAFGDALMDIPAVNVANALAKRNIPVYFYRFNYRPLLYYKHWIGVPHGTDLFFVFGSTFTNISFPIFLSEDCDVSLFVMSHWADFVKSGTPLPSEKQDAILYQPTQPAYMLIQSGTNGTEFLMDYYPYKERKVDFWNNYLPRLIARFRNISQEQCPVPTTRPTIHGQSGHTSQSGLPTTVVGNHATDHSQCFGYQVFTLMIILQTFYTFFSRDRNL